jgi:hypothetical protein
VAWFCFLCSALSLARALFFSVFCSRLQVLGDQVQQLSDGWSNAAPPSADGTLRRRRLLGPRVAAGCWDPTSPPATRTPHRRRLLGPRAAAPPSAEGPPHRPRQRDRRAVAGRWDVAPDHQPLFDSAPAMYCISGLKNNRKK